jgi:PIN domain nuclease of toxin-antitoxin system
MHRVWEWDFAQHAKDCQKLAAETKTRTRKIELLSLAAVWELLAQVRAEQLGRYEQDVIAPKKLHNLS